MECTNNTTENDSNLTITETDLSENVTNLNTAMDLADIITGRKKCGELIRDEKHRYYKNYFTPTKNNQLYQEKVTKKGETFNLTFKHEWLTNHPWHVYSKELDGHLCKTCVLFDKSKKNQGIFVKNAFQKVSKPEKIKEYETLAYHPIAMLKAKDFINSCEYPTTNVEYDAEKEKQYENNLHVLKRVIQAVKVCAK